MKNTASPSNRHRLTHSESKVYGTTAKIKGLVIRGLFGFFNYTIPVHGAKGLLLLYGENGCGKTTILNLLYHMLSPIDGRGHRSYLASKAFQEFSVHFVDGAYVTARRLAPKKGGFTMTAKTQEFECTHEFTINSQGKVGEQDDKDTYLALLRVLERFGFGLFLLPDDRNIKSNLYDDESGAKHRRFSADAFIISDSPEPEVSDLDAYVALALSRSFDWTRKQAITASNQGETDTTKIYIEIISRLVSDKGNNIREKVPYERLLEEIASTQKRSMLFSKYGLTPPFIFSELIEQLAQIPTAKKGVVNQVLLPYLRSYQARLNALDLTRSIIDTFSGIFNSFYSHKRFIYDLKAGIRIESINTGETLDSNVLSSGEKQLLLLFCNVLLARSSPSLFIIDEPELSLNVKWQRNLVEGLSACVHGCDVQFLFATHSIELLASWKESAVRLNHEA